MTEEAQNARRARNKKQLEKKISLRQAYQTMFLGDNGKLRAEALVILKDLSTYCHAKKSSARVNNISGMIDPFATHLAEGQRRVFLYVLNNINTDDAMFNRLITQYYEETDL